MLVPEQRQGNWRGFVVLTVINHSPELNCLTRTFLAALLLSHPEKQMVALLPCVCRNASQITQGVFSDVCVCGKVRLAQLSNFTRIGKNSDCTFHGRGKELFAAVWQMKEGEGHSSQRCDPSLWLHQQEHCFRRSFKRNDLFQHFIWLQVPLEWLKSGF